MKKISYAFILSLFITSCGTENTESESAALTKKKEADAIANDEKQETKEMKYQCKALNELFTVVTPLVESPSITAQTSNQYVDYKIKVEDCYGNTVPDYNASIKFDIDVVTNQHNFISYQMLSNSSVIGAGNFELVYGEDLFGGKTQNEEFQHFYMQTTGKYKAEFIFRVQFSHTAPLRENNGSTPDYSVLSGDFTSRLTFAFGDAKPVNQDVLIISPAIPNMSDLESGELPAITVPTDDYSSDGTVSDYY